MQRRTLGGRDVSAIGLGCMRGGRLRKAHPRFQGENFQRKLELVAEVEGLADKKGVKPGQVALEWVLSRREDVVSIPGATRREHLEENVAALDVELTEDDLERLERAFPKGAAAGERYADMSAIDRLP